MRIPKLEDGLLNPFISQQIQVVFRDLLYKFSSVHTNNIIFINYLRNIIIIESCGLSRLAGMRRSIGVESKLKMCAPTRPSWYQVSLWIYRR